MNFFKYRPHQSLTPQQPNLPMVLGQVNPRSVGNLSEMALRATARSIPQTGKMMQMILVKFPEKHDLTLRFFYRPLDKYCKSTKYWRKQQQL